MALHLTGCHAAPSFFLLLFRFMQSYGLNVARLAHLPESVILRAKAKSEEFEAAVEAAKRGELVLPASSSPSGGSIGADSDADAWAAFYDAADAFSAGGGDAAAAALLSTARRLRGVAAGPGDA